MKVLQEFLFTSIKDFFRNTEVRKAINSIWISKLPKTTDDYADDTEAATGGVKIGELYHTSGAVKIRLS